MIGWYGGMMGGYPAAGSVIAIFAVWSLVWKGFALWQSARNGQKWWFIAFLLVNSIGLLEILYLFVFARGEKGLPWMKSTPVAAIKQVKKPVRRRK